MVDATTTNILLTVPARGNDPGTWDVPVNSNSNAIDGFLGGVQTIALSGSNVTLTAPSGVVVPTSGPTQSQNAVLRCTGAISNNLQILLPLPGYFIVENLTTGGSFILSFAAVGGGDFVCVDRGATQHIYNDGTNVKYVNMPPVGSYLDICDSTVPLWITASSKPPYLNCDGSTFNATTYPYLNSKLGGNTLPDLRGVARYTLNQGTSRLTTAGSGLDGNTRFANKFTQTYTLVLGNLPPYTPSGTFVTNQTGIPLNVVGFFGQRTDGSATGVVGPSGGVGTVNVGAASGSISGFAQGGTSIPFGVIGTGAVSGITLIRAG